MKKRSAFTLIEISISLLIFTIFVSVILASVLHILNAQIEANRYRGLYSEINDVLALITADMREYALDYDCLAAGGACEDFGRENTVAFVNKVGTERRLLKIVEVDSDLPNLDKEYELYYQIQTRVDPNNAAGWTGPAPQQLTSDLVVFTGFELSVFPELDPYRSSVNVLNDDLFQPHIRIDLAALPRTYPERQPLRLSTAISSRVYNIRSS